MSTIQYKGLSEAEVLESRKKYGENILTPPEKDSLWKLFFEKLTGPFGHRIKGWQDGDPLIFILEIAALLSVGISIAEYTELFGLHNPGIKVFFEPLGILIAILLATGMAFIFELKADKEFAILNQVNDDEPVQAIRDGNVMQISRREVVVGDIIMLSTGEEIPADGELLDAVSLNVDESSLTGEPICRKTVNAEDMDADATFPSNHVMRGTKVMEGHGVCRIFAVGDKTENGKVFVAAQIDDSVKTPLNEQLDRLGMMITKTSYIIAAGVIIGRVTMFFINMDGFEWIEFITYLLQTIMIAVTLIVVAVPEGLPMAVTLSLAYSMRRMLRTNNLVRKMHACETMGATTVICTDKTGTLTMNRMKVAEFVSVGTLSEKDKELLNEGIAVNSTAELDKSADEPVPVGNPTEGALLLWLAGNNADYSALRAATSRIAEEPFTTERKYMSTTVRSAVENGKEITYIKGAPEIVMNMCDNMQEGTDSRTHIMSKLHEFQNQAMRTLGFACKSDGSTIMMGVVAISDPVRNDVPAAVNECINAGINIKIVTGDTPGTAKEIGRQIGLYKDNDGERCVITGPEFEKLSEKELYARVAELKIIARARPMDKKRLVEALQKKGDVVAVTGDGTNDAPALKAAHVGLSMGDGTSVAKEASDITIIDNSFSSIGRAVMWGRSLYQNIQRFILFQMTVNVAACLVVLVGSFMGTEAPLTVTQMLWVNLIMDTFAAMALASLPPASKVMNDKPRNRNSFIISKDMWTHIIGVGSTFFIMLIILLYMMEHSTIHSTIDIFTSTIGKRDGLDEYELSLFFTIFVMLQFWNMFNARAFATGRSAFHFAGCKGFMTIAALIFFGQIGIITVGGEFFNVTPITITDWIMIIGVTSAVVWIGEIIRSLFRR